MRLASSFVILSVFGFGAFLAAEQRAFQVSSVDLTNLQGTISAQQWKAFESGGGTITAEGSYSAEVNTPTKDITETLEFFLSITVTYMDKSKESGSEYVTAKKIEKPGLAGTINPEEPFKETVNFSLQANDTTDLKAAIDALFKKLDARRENQGDPVDKIEVHTKVENALSTRIVIHIKGEMRGTSDTDDISDKGTLSFYQQAPPVGNSKQGDSIRTINLSKLD